MKWSGVSTPRILHVALTFASNIKCALRIYRINFEQVAKRGRGKSQKLQVVPPRGGVLWCGVLLWGGPNLQTALWHKTHKTLITFYVGSLHTSEQPKRPRQKSRTQNRCSPDPLTKRGAGTNVGKVVRRPL